jgi:carbamoyltransferase
MKLLGINALNHDASMAVVDRDGIQFWKRASEFSKVDHDIYLNQDLVDAAMNYHPNRICWYERPWIKKTRQMRAGQWHEVFDRQMIPRVHLNKFKLKLPISYCWHHKSHAAAGFYTSPFDRATVVVVDAMGEWTTTSIWIGDVDKGLSCVWQQHYPHSMGLFYSAFTDFVGLKPAAEEHLFQQLSEQGDPYKHLELVKNYFTSPIKMRYNLHCGVTNWPLSTINNADIAASVQMVFEEHMRHIMTRASQLTGLSDLVYMGGCSMNSLFNQQLDTWWGRVWSLPTPGDAASSFGAALSKLKCKVPWTGQQSRTTKL